MLGFVFVLCCEIWHLNLKPYGCSAHNQVISQQQESRVWVDCVIFRNYPLDYWANFSVHSTSFITSPHAGTYFWNRFMSFCGRFLSLTANWQEDLEILTWLWGGRVTEGLIAMAAIAIAPPVGCRLAFHLIILWTTLNILHQLQLMLRWNYTRI